MFAKPASKSLRRKSGRKPGGQPGHPGSTLAQVADPNERLRHEPGRCAGCGSDLADAHEVGMEKRQVFDLPPMTVEVTEHQLIARRCACGATTCGTALQGVSAPVQYGPRITAIVLYLYSIPVPRTSVYAGQSMFSGTLTERACTQRAQRGLAERCSVV